MSESEYSAFRSLLKDEDLIDEIRNRASEGKLAANDDLVVSPELIENRLAGGAPRPSALEGARARAPRPAEGGNALEAIVLVHGRPSLLVQNGTFRAPDSAIWRDVLRLHRSNIESAIARVGRVELHNHRDYQWVGTGWIVAPGIVVTNRHVAEIFAVGDGDGGFAFATNFLGQTISAQVDFREEFEVDASFEVRVPKILYVAERNEPDIALLAIETDVPLPDPLPLSTRKLAERQTVGVVGYPAIDTRNGLDAMRNYFGEVYDVKRFAPGRVSFPTPAEHYFVHDCTTLGGCSGGSVVDLESGEVVGLHFSGSFLEGNFAVKADFVREALGALSTSISVPLPAEEEAVADGRHKPEFFVGRDGYREDFLGAGHPVPMPGLGAWDGDAVKRAVESDHPPHVLPFRHFSVVMSESRKLPLISAVNINGAEARRVFRDADKWYIDLRIDERNQLGNEIYRNNDLDRGHMVRRLDPVWGSLKESREANEDTFHYVNAAPQHKDLNRREWNDLEDYILDSAKAKDFKVSVFTGPVLRKRDRSYRGLVKLPEEFWKVAVMINTRTNRLSAAGYTLTQGEMIRDVTEAAFVFGEFRTYQVQIAKLERETGLDFGALKEVDALVGAGEEGVPLPRARLIRGARDLVL